MTMKLTTEISLMDYVFISEAAQHNADTLTFGELERLDGIIPYGIDASKLEEMFEDIILIRQMLDE